MTVSWSLTTTATARIDTTIGIAGDHDAAVTAALVAALDAITAAELSAAPHSRYELHAGYDLIAIIQSGVDDDGRPDHASTRALIQRIECQRYLRSSPY